MNEITLSKKQVIQLHNMLVLDYPEEDTVTLEISYASGIGPNINAVVKYTACHTVTRDITDYDTW